MRRLSRREFIVSSVGIGAALGCSSALLSGCHGGSDGSGSSPRAPGAQDQVPRLPSFGFSESQRNALSAAVARLIPASGAGDWSAADAGAVEYIELLLNSFSKGGNPKVYGGGPTRDRFARFHALSRVKIAGWLTEVLRLRDVYVAGLDELNRLARGPLSLLPGEFATLPEPAQDGILQSLDYQGSAFFATLFAHTMEGVYGHPVYGGNRDYIAWSTFCYQGDVHGVRFPDGHDPAADAQPWNKYGGYSPEEISEPPTSC